MSNCEKMEYSRSLEFYLLDLLSEADTAAFEEHLLMCDHCAHEVEQFNEESIQLLTSQAIKDELPQIIADEDKLADTETEPQERRGWYGSGRNWGLLAAAAILVMTVVWPWKFQVQVGDEATASGLRLAVLPFDNLTSDSTVDWQRRALSNLLITDLTDSRRVTVIPEQNILSILEHRTASGDSVTGLAKKVEIAREAKAKWVVIGSMIRVEPNLTVVVSIIDVKTSDTVSSHVATLGPNQDLFSLIDGLSSAISSDASPMGPDNEDPARSVSEMTTNSLDAYRYYLEGIDQLHRYQFNEAQFSLRRALEYDSAMAMANYYLSMAQLDSETASRAAIGRAVTYIDRSTAREQFYIRSRSAFALGDTAHAISHLLELCESYPDESEAYYVLAFYEAARRDTLTAIHYAEAAIERDPYYKLAFNFLVYMYQGLGEYDKALTSLDWYIKIAPGEPNPLDTKGEILALQGRFEEALEAYSNALVIAPEFHTSRISRAAILMLLERNDELQVEIAHLLGAQDGGARSWGRTLELAASMRAGKFEQTLLDMPGAIENDAADSPYIGRAYKLGLQVILEIELGRTEDALNTLSALSLIYNRIAPSEQLDALRFRGYALSRLGRVAEAENLAIEVRQSLGVEEGETGYNYIMGFVMLAREDWSRAAAFLESAMSWDDEYLLKVGLARAYIEQQNNVEAIKLLEQMLGSFDRTRALLGTVDVKLYYYLGIAHEQAGEYGLAMEHYEQFLHTWSEADVDILELADAERRLNRLRSSP